MTGSKVIGEITAITKVQALFRGKRERKQGIKKEEDIQVFMNNRNNETQLSII